MTTSLPSDARTPVSRDVAKPRKPPTRVRPSALAACAGSEADPSVRSLGLSTGGEPAEEDGKTREVETRGAGSTPISRVATRATITPDSVRVPQGTPLVPVIDCHMANSPQRPQPSQARTNTPRARSTDCAAATATRAVDPASE